MNRLNLYKKLIKTASESAVLEYRRDVTSKQFGDKLIDKYFKDDYFVTPGLRRTDIPAEKLAAIPDKLYDLFEAIDKTKDHQYVPFLAKLYASTPVKYEDLVKLEDTLPKYHTLKQRNLLQPEHKDIMRFKAAYDLMDVVDALWTEDVEAPTSQAHRGTSKEFYKDSEMRIIIPLDMEAAIYYGQGTRWCTAAVRHHNMFDWYNNKGPLYIILPVQPQYTGEKYQLHFESESFMNEQDGGVSLDYLIETFSSFEVVFKDQLKDYLLFIPREQFNSLRDSAIELLKNYFKADAYENHYLLDYYNEMLDEAGYVPSEENGGWDAIDWDKVEEDGYGFDNYILESEDYYLFTKLVNRTYDIDFGEFKDAVIDYNYNHNEARYFEYVDVMTAHADTVSINRTRLPDFDVYKRFDRDAVVVTRDGKLIVKMMDSPDNLLDELVYERHDETEEAALQRLMLD